MFPSDQRYHRQLLLRDFGSAAQAKLSRASVTVIGAGGLGCPVLMYLSAAGVGNITIADPDTVELSNLHRQILFSESDIGSSKAERAAARCRALNSDITVNSASLHVGPENVLDLIARADVVVDATDNFTARYCINDACVILDTPLVYSSVYEHLAQLSVFNYQLQSAQRGGTLRCLYPVAPDPASVPSCDVQGVLGVVPGLMGVAMASQVISVLTDSQNILRNKLLVADVSRMNFSTIEYQRDESRWGTAPRTRTELEAYNYPAFCGETQEEEMEVGPDELRRFLLKDVRVVDIREAHETSDENPTAVDLRGMVRMSLEQLIEDVPSILPDTHLLIVCRTGRRSLTATQLLRSRYHLPRVYSLRGGTEGLVVYRKSHSNEI